MDEAKNERETLHEIFGKFENHYQYYLSNLLIINELKFVIVKTKLSSVNFDKVKKLCQSRKLLKINYLRSVKFVF